MSLAPQTESSDRKAIFAFSCALAIGSIAMLWLFGVGLFSAIILTAVIAVQSLCGSILWLITRRKPTTIPETLGIGIAIGIVLAIIVGLLLRTTPIASFSWLVLPVATFSLLAWLRSARKHPLASISPLERSDIWAAIVGLGAGFLVLTGFFREQPLEIINFATYFVDVPFHEALSNGIASYGPYDSVFSSGDSYRYHWFSHAWSGFNHVWASTAPLVTVTRALPIVTLIATVLLSIAWISRLSKNPWAKSSVALLATGGLAIGPATMSIFLMHSPSHLLGLALLLATAFLVFEFVFERLPRSGLFLIALIAFGNMGAKVSSAAILCAGLAGLFLFALINKAYLRKVILAIFSVAIGTLLGYVFAISGGKAGLDFGFGAVLDRFDYQVPSNPIIAVIFSTVVLLLWRLPTLLSVTLGLRSSDKETRAMALTSFTSGLAGLIAVLVLVQPGISQYFFLWAAYPLIFIAAVAGTADMCSKEKVLSKPVVVSAIGVGLLVQIGTTVWWNSRGLQNTPSPLKTLLLIWAIFLLTACIATLVIRTNSDKKRWSFVTYISICVLAASCIAGITATISAHLYKPENTISDWSTTSDDIAAAKWLSANAGDDLTATNKFCHFPQQDPITTCAANSFTVSAFSGKRMLIEGHYYRIGTNSELTPQEASWVRSSIGFSKSPNCENGKVLWNNDVRYVWVNTAYTDQTDWSPYANIVFDTPTVKILKLNPVECFR